MSAGSSMSVAEPARQANRAWLETAAITAAAAALAWWWRANGGGYEIFIYLPAPFICGLRQGYIHGVVSSLCLFAVTQALFYLQGLPPFPLGYGVGMLLVGVATGEASDVWRRRVARLESESLYHRLRLLEFGRSYQALQVSHRRLEQKLAAGPTSLRTALVQLEQDILAAQRRADDLDAQPLARLGEPILRLFAEHVPIHTAALYAVQGAARSKGARLGAAKLSLCSRLGDPPPLSPENALLRAAMRSANVASIPSVTHPSVGGVLAIVPIADIEGETRAVVAIHEMSYAAFQPSTWSELAVIGGHIGDLLMRNAFVLGSHGAERHFLHALERCLTNHRQFGQPSALIVFKLHPALDATIGGVLMDGRCLDFSDWGRDVNGRLIVRKLLPLTDSDGVQGYVRRLDEAVQEQHGTSLHDLGVDQFGWTLPSNAAAPESLSQFARRCKLSLDPAANESRPRQRQAAASS